MKTIKLEKLDLSHESITSASALINLQKKIFLCCDDQYGIFELYQGNQWIHHEWPEAPVLPEDHQERKKLKPDFEALLKKHGSDDTIMLIPSGSTDKRTKILEFNLSNHQFSQIDMSFFYQRLSNKLNHVNIEGAVVHQSHYLFLNRGVKKELSSILRINPDNFEIETITPIEFGSINNVSLHGSELYIFNNHLFAVAVAEATENAYDDGKVLGSHFFQINLENFLIEKQWRFNESIKIEGLCRHQDKWLITTDPDGLGHSDYFSFNVN